MWYIINIREPYGTLIKLRRYRKSGRRKEKLMKTLTVKRAEELKAQGITHIAAVVKTVYATAYYNVNSIDALLANGGKWIAAEYGTTATGLRVRLGTNASYIDWTVTARTSAL